MCSCTLWNVNPEVVHSIELVLHERMSGVHNVQGCDGEPLAMHGLQITDYKNLSFLICVCSVGMPVTPRSVRPTPGETVGMSPAVGQQAWGVPAGPPQSKSHFTSNLGPRGTQPDQVKCNRNCNQQVLCSFKRKYFLFLLL